MEFVLMLHFSDFVSMIHASTRVNMANAVKHDMVTLDSIKHTHPSMFRLNKRMIFFVD